MPEMPDTGEHHGDAVVVGGLDHFVVADRSAGLDHSCCAGGPLLNKAFQKRMYFAGEHTCFAYFGYMEGALQSGQRAASSILKAVARQNKKAN
jgi:monoamine oxidase